MFVCKENYGLITFKEANLFVDPSLAAISAQRSVTEVILHEMSHLVRRILHTLLDKDPAYIWRFAAAAAAAGRSDSDSDL